MGLFDRFRKGGGPSRSGVRNPHRAERPSQHTVNIHVQPRPQPAHAPQPEPSGHTVARPVSRPPARSQAPPTPLPDAPPAAPREEASDAFKTIIEPVDRPRAGKIVAVLVGVDGPIEGELFGIRDGENNIGRGANCHVTLPNKDRRVSREHAKVIHREGIFVIQPIKEQAITMVNGEPTGAGAEIQHGDSVTLGDSTFRFLSVN